MAEDPKPNEDPKATDPKPTDGPTADDIEKMQAALKKANDEAAKYRHEAKAKDDELSKLKADADSSKSEMDKVREQIDALQGRAEKAEREALVAKVAQSKKLPAALASRLSGATQEELEADADGLIEALGIDTSDDDDGEKPSTSPRRPKERLKPGAAPEAEPEENDPQKLAERIPRDT